MAKKVYSKAEKRSWLNGLRLGQLRAGKKSAPKKNGLGYSNKNSSFNVDEFYEKALKRTAARTTKSVSNPNVSQKSRAMKKRSNMSKGWTKCYSFVHSRKTKFKTKDKISPYDDFEWGPTGIKGAYTVDGFFEPD